LAAGSISTPPLRTSGPPAPSEAADTSEVFEDAQAAEHHREAARRQEGDADDERHRADDER
jgi:hypothetical protein